MHPRHWFLTAAETVRVVETLPVTECSLKPIAGVLQTVDADLEVVRSAQRSLDIMAMYWHLLPTSNFSKNDLQRLGAGRGAELYNAIDSAAGE